MREAPLKGIVTEPLAAELRLQTRVLLVVPTHLTLQTDVSRYVSCRILILLQRYEYITIMAGQRQRFINLVNVLNGLKGVMALDLYRRFLSIVCSSVENLLMTVGNMVAQRIIAPPMSVMSEGISLRSTMPKRIPQTGSRLARRLADWAVIFLILAIKRV